MDTTDPLISFDESGQCNHCRDAGKRLLQESKIAYQQLSNPFEKISLQRRNSKFDAIIGLSGGIDSSYVLLKAIEAGVRPLVVHVDAGWNTAESVSNIESLVNKFNLDLETVVIDWVEMRELQLSYLRSGLLNQDSPQDHAFFAGLYQTSRKHRINQIISGSNLATESILPKSWGHDAMDGLQLREVAKRFDGPKLSNFPVLRLPSFYIYDQLIRRMVVHCPLDSVPYKKNAAMSELIKACGWKEYGGKHRESAFTSFYQHIYLPRRFGIDKRKAHLSSLIVSGQITRELALDELRINPIPTLEAKSLIQFVCRKLDISPSQMENFMSLPYIDHRLIRNDRSRIERLLDSAFGRTAKNVILSRIT